MMTAVNLIFQNQMKKKIDELLKQARDIMGEDADYLIIARKDGQFGAAAHGSAEDIAEAIFSCMHNTKDSMSQALYRIIKLNVMNIMGNQSCFSYDLVNTLESIFPDHE